MATLTTLLVDGNGVVGPRAWAAQAFGDIDEGIAGADGTVIGRNTGTPGGEDADTSFTLANVDTDLGNMDTLLFNARWQVNLNSSVDDNVQMGFRLMSGATVLAASTSGGAMQFIAAAARTPTTLTTTGATAFSFVNTTATKAQWDAAELEIENNYAGFMAKDTNKIHVELDTIEFTGTYTISSTFTPEQTDWRWFQNDAIDPTTANAFAAENTKPTLPGDENYEVIRLRVLLQENGGAADSSKIVTLEFTGDGGTTRKLFANSGSIIDHMEYGNGLATNGDTIATTRMTNANTAGEYHEDLSGTESLAASETGLEIDFAITTTCIIPDTDYDVRVIWDGTAVPVKSGSSIIQLRGSTAATRSYNDGGGDILNTVNILDHTVDSEVRSVTNGHGQKGFYDGTRWWSFYVYDGPNTTTLRYKSSTNLALAWSSEATVTFTDIQDNENWNVDFKNIGGTLYVLALVRDNASTWTFKRGTISGGTITWDGTERSFTPPHNNEQNRSPQVRIAADDRFWFGALGNTASNELWMERSTNTLDNSSYFTMSETALSISDGDLDNSSPWTGMDLLAVNTSDVLIAYYNVVQTDLEARLVTTSSIGAATTVNVSTDAHRTDWSIAKDASGNIYAMYKEGTANVGDLALRVYSISGNSWSTGTDPAHTTEATNADGLMGHMGDDGTFRAFWTENDVSGSNTQIMYLEYTAGGDSGTWDVTPTALMAGGKGNGDGMAIAHYGGANATIFFERGEDALVGTRSAHEYYHLDTAAAAPAGPFPPGFRRRQLTTVRM